MDYSKRDMKLMAAGEYGAVILGIALGVISSKVFHMAPIVIRGICAFFVFSYATTYALRFVHWGYKTEENKQVG